MCQTEVIQIYTVADKKRDASVHRNLIREYTMKFHSDEVKDKSAFVSPTPVFQTKYLSQHKTQRGILAFTKREIA